MSNSRIPWLRVLLEGVVIVASVLLALAADAWRQDRQDRRDEQALLRGLRSEFLANADQLDQRITEHQRLAQMNEGLLQILWETSEPSVIVPDTLLYGLTVITTYDATLGTLEEARSSGRTRLIRDERIRALLGAWPGRLQDAQEEIETARRNQDTMREALLDSVDMSVSIGSGTGRQSPVPRWLRGEDPYLSGEPRLLRVPTSTLLANFAAVQRRALSRSAGELAGLRTSLDSLVTLIDHETTGADSREH